MIEDQFTKIASNMPIQQSGTNYWGQDPLAMPPRPLKGSLGEFEQGKSNRFRDTRMPADLNSLFQDGEFDYQAYCYHAASLQLMNIELVEQIDRKENEYSYLEREVTDLHKSMEHSLKLQDKLFIEHFQKNKQYKKEKKEWEREREEMKSETIELKHEIDLQKEKYKSLQTNNRQSLIEKFEEQFKKISMMDVALIRLSRKLKSTEVQLQEYRMLYD